MTSNAINTVPSAERNVDVKIQRDKKGNFSLTGCPAKMALIADAAMSAYNRARYDGGINKQTLAAHEDTFVTINRELRRIDWDVELCNYCTILTGESRMNHCPYNITEIKHDEET